MPFPSSAPQAGRCLFLETIFFGRAGSPGSRSNSRPPPSGLPLPGPPPRGALPGATRARSWPPGVRSLPLVSRPGRGQELGVGRRPLGSWSLLCSRPAPTGEGRRGGSGGCARGTSGGLGPGPGLGRGPGLLPAFQSGPALGVLLGAQIWCPPLSAPPVVLSPSSPPLPILWSLSPGAPEGPPALELVSHFVSVLLAAEPQFSPG